MNEILLHAGLTGEGVLCAQAVQTAEQWLLAVVKCSTT